MEDLYDIRKVSEEMCILCSRVIVHVCIRLYIKGQAIQDVQRKSEWISIYSTLLSKAIYSLPLL